MEVTEYLNSEGKSLDTLKEEYGIKVTQNPDYPLLYCLNYCQINSPKFHPIVRECRSLVVVLDEETGNFYPQSRSFDRFFNYSEDPDQVVDITKLEAFEKLDGSLVTLFCYRGEWLYRTKSMIMPAEDMMVNGSDLSWKELIEGSLQEFCEECVWDYRIWEGSSFIFEITSPENRVVTRYTERQAYLLAVRGDTFGGYLSHEDVQEMAEFIGVNYPKKYSFDTMEHCLEASKNLPNLEEGYVMYNKYGVPVMKVKSPAYVAAHRLRGENVLTGKRIMDLIFINEHEEYLAIFPEDKDRFYPYLIAQSDAEDQFEELWQEHGDKEDQKEFALCVKDEHVNTLMFMKRQNIDLTFQQCFDRLRDSAKYRIVEGYLCKK